MYFIFSRFVFNKFSFKKVIQTFTLQILTSNLLDNENCDSLVYLTKDHTLKKIKSTFLLDRTFFKSTGNKRGIFTR